MVNAKTLDLDQLFAEEYIKTSEDVFRALDNLEEAWKAGRASYSREYCDCVVRLIREFRALLQKHILFDCPDGYWGYAIVLRGGGIYLMHLCEASHKWSYAKCFFMQSFSLDLADSLVFKGEIASHKTVTDSYVAIGSSPPSVYRNTASLTQELGCS